MLVNEKQKCAILNAMDVLEGKWKIIVLYRLSEETLRFKELQHMVAGISPKMLTSVLEGLENDGMISRTVAMTKPLKVEYALTAKGILIKPVLAALDTFGKELA